MAVNKMSGGVHGGEVCGNSGRAAHGPSSIPNYRSGKGAADAARSSNRGGKGHSPSKSKHSPRGY